MGTPDAAGLPFNRRRTAGPMVGRCAIFAHRAAAVEAAGALARRSPGLVSALKPPAHFAPLPGPRRCPGLRAWVAEFGPVAIFRHGAGRGRGRFLGHLGFGPGVVLPDPPVAVRPVPGAGARRLAGGEEPHQLDQGLRLLGQAARRGRAVFRAPRSPVPAGVPLRSWSPPPAPRRRPAAWPARSSIGGEILCARPGCPGRCPTRRAPIDMLQPHPERCAAFMGRFRHEWLAIGSRAVLEFG